MKLLAQREGIPLLQPLKMKDPEFLQTLAGWKPDLIAVTAFGRILPSAVLSLPPRGCINVHGSLLPKYRGAGPIQWAIINGERETGITTMLMDEGMDTGAMLRQEAIPITADDTAATLARRLAALGGRLLVETIAQLKAGTRADATRFFTSDHGSLAEKEDGSIDWTLPAVTLANRIRGLAPWPGAYTAAPGATVGRSGERTPSQGQPRRRLAPWWRSRTRRFMSQPGRAFWLCWSCSQPTAAAWLLRNMWLVIRLPSDCS